MDGDIFAAIRRQDILLHHPYDSFDPVVDFLEAAARDPAVLAIKQTLYRVGQNSPVVEALLEAVRRGKQVAVLVELKARFDEESNIEWARALESEGVHVVYGLLGLKTHSKIALVVRQESDRIRRYVHLSTGNYNAVTAHQYTDLGLFTCDDAIGADASDVFNYLTGYSDKRAYRGSSSRRSACEAGWRPSSAGRWSTQRAGGEGHLIIKINAVVDKAMIQLLYEASRAGGAHRPDRARDVLPAAGSARGEREHPGAKHRGPLPGAQPHLLVPTTAGSEEVFLGSADLMGRNLDRRVEILFPVLDPRLVAALSGPRSWTPTLRDTAKARIMQRGRHLSPRRVQRRRPVDSQAEFIRLRQAMTARM